MFKESVVLYPSLDSGLTSVSKGRVDLKPLVPIRNAVLRGYTLLPSAFRRERRTPVVELYFLMGMHQLS